MPRIYISQIARLRTSARRGMLRQLWHYVSRGPLTRNFTIRRFLSQSGFKCLQIGGGRHVVRQWINGDLIFGDIYLNAQKRLPFPDDSLDAVFTEQFFEHLPLADGRHLLCEIFRVLKPGGILRQSTPDLAGLIAIYLDTNEFTSREEAVRRHIINHCKGQGYNLENACQFLNDFNHLWGHQFLYDRQSLERLNLEAGFTELEWRNFGESPHSELRNRERHADLTWMEKAFVVIYETRKPQN